VEPYNNRPHFALTQRWCKVDLACTLQGEAKFTLCESQSKMYTRGYNGFRPLREAPLPKGIINVYIGYTIYYSSIYTVSIKFTFHL